MRVAGHLIKTGREIEIELGINSAKSDNFIA
jgi:hypothetical protein